nr:DNA annealing helicase and endonuclease ZRANB3 isoform X1 [Ipomoea batatas]
MIFCRLQRLVAEPNEGNAWHADHIIPVYKGGGECLLENMRTLCVACHADVTAAQHNERRKERLKAKKHLRNIMRDLKTVVTLVEALVLTSGNYAMCGLASFFIDPLTMS